MKRIHDFVSHGYDSDAGIIRNKNDRAIEQLIQALTALTPPLRLIDLGVGDGAFLSRLAEQIGEARFTGVDLSSKMVEKAAGAVPGLEGIVSDIRHVAEHTKEGGWDVAIAHFVLAYVDIDTLIAQAKHVLRPGGLFSFVTSTNSAANVCRREIARLRATGNPIDRLAAWVGERGIERTQTPNDFEEMAAALAAQGFSVASRESHSTRVVLNDSAEAYEFGITKGWGVNAISIPLLPTGLLLKIAEMALDRCEYPYVAEHTVEMVVARKDG
ncbi:MAG: class I SAM-dependent methyltransferase [Alphaproteobacteria bacterium]|nr:class I SAM-dependent methyltransferase [Alphaproteobacteria bacterium]